MTTGELIKGNPAGFTRLVGGNGFDSLGQFDIGRCVAPAKSSDQGIRVVVVVAFVIVVVVISIAAAGPTRMIPIKESIQERGFADVGATCQGL